MSSKIPHTFLESSEATVNVSYTDFASGTGIVQFFLGNTASANRLSENAFYSDDRFIKSTVITTATPTLVLDEDFDATFLRPVIIDGQAIFSLGIAMANDEDASFNVYAVIKVRSWDGTTETDIVSVSGVATPKNWQPGAAIQKGFTSHTLNVDIPRTTFKIGESLRITVELWSASNGTGDIQLALGVDPQNRTGAYPGNQDQDQWGDFISGDQPLDVSAIGGAFANSSAHIPFKIDI